MAIYKLQPSVSQPIGSIKGATFQRSCKVFAIRKKSAPTRKNTAKKQRVKNTFQAIANTWRTRSNFQKSTYSTNAPLYPRFNSLGVPYVISPTALQISQNTGRSYSNLTLVATMSAPGTSPVIIASGATIVRNTQNMLFALTPSSVPGGWNYKLYLTRPLSPGLTVIPAHELKHVVTFGGGNTTNFNIWNFYISVFGSIQNNGGQFVYGEFRQMNSSTQQVMGIWPIFTFIG